MPVSPDEKSKLDAKVDAYIADLIAQDPNSPAFGQKVSDLTNMGRKEIAAASEMSNRFLDRPIKAMDKDSGVGANLAELRSTLNPWMNSLQRSPNHYLRYRVCWSKVRGLCD